MAKSFVQQTAEKVARLEGQSRNTTVSSRLDNASLEDTVLEVFDRYGIKRAEFGKQPDGSFGGLVRNSLPQPTLTAPVLPVPAEGEPVRSSFPVGWDGQVVSGFVSQVHGHTEVWGMRTVDGQVASPEDAKLMGTIRDRAGGTTTVAAGAAGTWTFWLRMVGQDRVTKGDFSAPSTVTVTALVDSQDIEERLNAFAEGELPDGAYENLLVRLGEFMNIRADQIDVNSLAADSAFITLLETAGIVLRNEGQGRRTEVSGQGLQVFDTTTSNLMIQLGNFTGGDLLSLFDSETGSPTVTMTGAGGLSAMHINSQWDPTIGGKPLMGDLFESPSAAASESVLESVSLGASGVLVRPFSGANGPSPRGIAFIEKKVKPGRSYRISVPDFQMGDQQDYYLSCYYTTSTDPDVRPALPTNNSANMGTKPGVVPPTGFGWPTTSLSFEKVYVPTTERWIRVQVTIGRYGGGNVMFGSSNTIATNPRVLIEDLGPRTGDGGRVTWRDPSSTTPSDPPADLVTLPYAVSQTATYTWNPSTGLATRQGIDVEPRFGFWPNGLYYLTLVQFQQWNQGGSLVNVDINVNPARWATSSGQVIQSGLVNMTGTPPVSFDAPSANNRLADLLGVGAGSTRQLPLEEMNAQMQGSQSRAAILLGWSGWTGSSQNNAAAGVLNRDRTFARLHTTTANADGQATSDG